MKKPFLAETIAALFIVLFVYAAVSKLTDYQKFSAQLGQSPLLTSFAGWVAWMIPLLEICISLLLLTDKYMRVALYASFTLMTMFSAYIIAITQFSEFIPCSCGGILQHMSWTQHLIFNIVFILLALAGILILSKKEKKVVQQF